ncbi:MAG: NUDIX domain-containing protein [Chloroflexota bacterium]
MIKLAATVAIVEAGKVLLAKREDFEVWCLPGGMVDLGESLAETAVREAREETGLIVNLTRLVGIYSEIGSWNDVHLALFAAKAVGGKLVPQQEEVLDLRYFAPNALPDYMFWWHRQQVADVFADVGGSVAWRQDIQSPKGPMSRAELYALRDESGMSRQDFYRWYYEKQGSGKQTRMVNNG